MQERAQRETGKESAFTIAAFLLAAVYLAVNAMLYMPAHRGVDQNGYLVGGKMLARHGSMAYRTIDPVTQEHDPFLFVGRMWVGYDLNGENERYYPKYPAGLPALYALALNIGGEGHGVQLAYWISPVAAALGLLAVFFLVRMIAPPVYAIMAMAVMCASPLTGWVTHNPNSHAANLMFAAWGMYFLFAWWKRDSFVRAGLAGLLLGCSATIRYTDILLVIPLLLVVYFNRREKKDAPASSIAQTAVMLLSWALPVSALIIHNVAAFGHATGYDTTNESYGLRHY